MIDKPSMLDGLHWKLLGNGLPAPTRQLLAVRSEVPVGKPDSRRTGPEGIGGTVGIHTFAEYGNACAFVGAHQGRLLQSCARLPLSGSIPAEDTFHRNAINLRLVVRAGEAEPKPAPQLNVLLGSTGLPLRWG